MLVTTMTLTDMPRLIFSRLDTIVRIFRSEARLGLAGIASLLFTVLSIALTVSSNNRMYIMPRHGSSKRFFYNFFNVASVIFSVLSCLGFYGTSFPFFPKERAHTHTHTGLNFHDPYDGHAWKREWIGSSGKFMIAASTSRLLGILWSFISDKCCSSSDVSTDSFFVPYEEFAEDDKKRKLKYGELKRRRQLCCAFLTCSLLISILACTLFPVIINGVVKSGLRDYAVIGSEKSSDSISLRIVATRVMIFFTSPLSTLQIRMKCSREANLLWRN